MFTAVLLSAALGASSFVLPASPEGIGIGDIDGDSRNDVVLLLVWPSWSSMTVFKQSSSEAYELEVKPAIEDRRELWAFHVEGSTLERIAAPLPVGREVIAIAPHEPSGPVVVLDDQGVARVVVDRTQPDAPVLKLERVATLRPLVAGAGAPLGDLPFLARLRPKEQPRIMVPTERGLAVFDASGGRVDLDAPFRQVSSGIRGGIEVSLPRRIDLDRDGNPDLLDIHWGEYKAALRRGHADGTFEAPVIWDLRRLVEPDPPPPPPAAGEMPIERRLMDVLDTDGDGTLEAVLSLQQGDDDSVREGMKVLRGVPGEYQLFPLARDGSVAKEPAGKIAIVGHEGNFDHPEGWNTPFRDLDGDGQPELVTLTVQLGYFGIAKGLVTRKMKLGVVPHVYRREGKTWSEVSDAGPKFELTADLTDLDSSRFFRIPGDLDGDGRTDMVQVAGREIEIHKGLPGARFSEKPTGSVRLTEKVRDFLGLFFVDLDGDGRREIIAFEEQPQEKDQPARPVRMEVRPLEAAP